MNSNGLDISLPDSMALEERRGGWTSEMRGALLACLLEADALTVQDFFDTVGNPSDDRTIAESTVDRLAAEVSPAEIYDAWLTSRDWAAVVQRADLVDVIGSEKDWTTNPDLVLWVSYWLTERANPGQLARLAKTVLGRERGSYDGTRWDAEQLAHAVARVVDPQLLAATWKRLTTPHVVQPIRRKIRRHHLTKSQSAELVTSWRRAHRSRGLRTSEAGRQLIQELREYRIHGVPVAEIAATLGVTVAHIYQLTRHPRHVTEAA